MAKTKRLGIGKPKRPTPHQVSQHDLDTAQQWIVDRLEELLDDRLERLTGAMAEGRAATAKEIRSLRSMVERRFYTTFTTDAKELLMARTAAEVLADIERETAENTTRITEQGTLLDGVNVMVQGNNAILAGVREQLAEAIANQGAGFDAAPFEAVIQTLEAAEQSSVANTAKIAAALEAGTPSGDPTTQRKR